MSTLTIARLTFQEAARRKILLAALVLGVIFLIVFGLGFYLILNEIRNNVRSAPTIIQLAEISNFLMMAALYVVNFLTVMMVVLTSVDTLSGEIASGTIHTIVSKPIRRWEVVAGKWLGFAGMLTLYLLLMAGGVMGVVYGLGRYIAPNPLQALMLMWLNALLMLTISLWGGTRFSTLANGVLVFGMFGIAFIGGWIEQIGSMLTNISAGQTAVQIGVVTSLLMPSEALWRLAANKLQSPLVATLGVSPFGSRSVPSPIFVIYTIGYVATMFFLAVRQFQKRDL